MDRNSVLQIIQSDITWDLIIIGGGATGIGAALEAATRGYQTLLLEQSDFTKSTSSKSTKLVHGGVRYLAQGDIKLVREASVERGLLVQNAPHLVKNQAFIIPSYSWWERPWFTVGLKLYDLLAGKLSLGPSVPISAQETIAHLPTIKTHKLRGGVLYHDGQFDDSRLAINVVQTTFEQGGYAVNYMAVTNLLKDENGKLTAVQAYDAENKQPYTIRGKMVLNATGVFTDQILKMDNPENKTSIRPSQGVHLVLDKEFLPGDFALMVPKTDDGRVLFLVPWHGKVIVGTTDTPVTEASLEPQALESEIEFILSTAGRFLTRSPKRADVRSVFAGLRPLAAVNGSAQGTKEVSRSHKIMVAPSGLVSILGGKWTTFRKMAEEAIDQIESVANWPHKPSVTSQLKIHGAANPDPANSLSNYGTDAGHIQALIAEQPELGEYLSQKLGILKAQVIWAVRKEMARNVEDVLARRVRALLLDARESIRLAPATARLMAQELGYSEKWQQQQIEEFTQLAQQYLLK
ncbi:glycerol-3-phosphate dehydrogenase/oxidase [Adhaeribacter radiodurans]|uniref:Glycerol-3-phosphate dehydrogenase/oxidase n=1 Tax=Adhaeribacter radiodurans TaxID=2745197 RepID=A0A7L7LE16_9BACT|nr:glycerol-3-phosphate dehydrogenase/oxidase [Adhaeribacter radiodurans]QMU31050.1 glycerol-3-phosphate dehydrogenase/oxidase [Adhaeribacter radiodurans]